MERKPISKRTRFEIFKRDGFRCAYCGRTPPDVLLHVDHIQAVANGGGNDPANLITACADCNLGKAAVPLSVTAPPLQRQAEEDLERAEQMRAYSETLLQARQQKDATIGGLFRAFSDSLDWPPEMDGQHLVMSAEHKASIIRFLERLSPTELLEAVDITASAAARKPWALGQTFKLNKDGTGSVTGLDRRWRYFCGVCWNKIKERDEAARKAEALAARKRYRDAAMVQEQEPEDERDEDGPHCPDCGNEDGNNLRVDTAWCVACGRAKTGTGDA